MSRKSYAIFGLGSFGTRLAQDLAQSGHMVLACDINPQRVEQLRDTVAAAVIADVSNPDALRELDIAKFDAVILSMSSFFEKQILALTLLKTEGAKKVLAKAVSDIQEKILYRLGADEVIQVEQDVAERLAKRLTLSNLTDFIEFRGEAIAEVVVPERMYGRTLKELNLRQKGFVTVLLVHKAGRPGHDTPGPDSCLEAGDRLTVFGNQQAIVDIFQED